MATTTEDWDRRAEQWAGFVRRPGADWQFEGLSWPAFAAMLPAPGKLTVDVACGEGRVGRQLARDGHTVVGADSSPAMVRLAAAAGSYQRVLHCPAAHIQLPDGVADLVVSFLALHDMEDVAAPVAEAARLLVPGGRLAVALLHPFAAIPGFDPAGRYLTPQRYDVTVDRAGMPMSFAGWRRPISAYTGAIEHAGLVIETLREPVPTAAAIAAVPGLQPFTEEPLFLLIRALRRQ
jgi:SAM-dependent methyltransferase